MTEVSRRGFLERTGLIAVGALGISASGAALAGCSQSVSTADAEAFVNALHIPAEAPATVDAAGIRRFALQAQPGSTEFVSGKTAQTAGYNGDYLGPTLRAKPGEHVAVDFANGLDEATTVHWHGMMLPARMDGGPHQMVDAGGEWHPDWTIAQPAATLWYHPHPHGETAQQVYRGLAGLFLIDDPAVSRAGVPSTYGVDDVPVILQDRSFTRDGDLSTSGADSAFGLLGDSILVNGTLLPQFTATTTLVRLRVVNGSNARVYHVECDDQRPFSVIATDTGLLEHPVSATQVLLSPAERVEIVVELQPGERVMLRSAKGTNDVLDNAEFNLLRLDAAEQLRPSPPLAADLPGARVAATPAAGSKARDFSFDNANRINGLSMDMNRIDEVVPAAALEEWRVANTVDPHNFHIHACSFRIVEIDGAEPPEWMRGPKDTVFVPHATKVRLAVQFGSDTDPATPYMYHCHLLRHEDEGMMGQFVVVEPGTEGGVSLRLPAAHQH
ncbi:MULTISPECIES: multicopper oxidase family protein [unclassified Pseudoclavibacter]|uniref:multicopper oxidase family protein n=1 Tax=unclassified Pseudoclavibacter TaxID=2615177 RepID=UPI0013015CE2|nr:MULTISPECIES: multicopper oxidase domain-containing protein [unclassified Pseudoclavibacter]KAB1645784.1 multicopper oxidase domain-containing protein [Pseudoclavibacter sp. CFCC 14310]KAB1664307.1 multicopper oxidase domain-containing protein [Pseudoclavibacter sp. CFCC 13611]